MKSREEKMKRPKTTKVRGIMLGKKFWQLYKQDDEFAYFVQKGRKHHRLPIPLYQLSKLNLIERRVAV